MLELRSVSEKNLWEITALSVREDQASFVASSTVSLLEAYVAVTAGFRENGERCGEELVAVRELSRE